MAGFALAIGLGALLLALPWATHGGGLGWVDALFTATSATCVTGLVVVDTGSALTGFGQGVVLALMQLGGLGIMTYSSLILLVMGQRLSFRGEALLAQTFGRQGRDSARQLVWRVVRFTLLAEGCGALVLFAAFLPEMGVGQALYHGTFHAVSAFCNAGFALNADSFTSFRVNPGVNATLMTLIVLGGLGFVVLSELAQKLRDRRYQRAGSVRLSLHTKVVLSLTVLLTLAGATAILAFESGGSGGAGGALVGMGWGERVLAALFQSVTARTAGFNTIDYGGLTNATLFLTLLLMFIGASPGSCGGGIKTTSLAVVAALFRARMGGQGRVSLFRRSVPEATVSRALSILVVSSVFVIFAAFVLVIFETGSGAGAQGRAAFVDLLFETVSAFGTVGLSTGATGGLSVFGKLWITMVMFVGRLGPLTLAMAVGRYGRRGRYEYAQENLMVG